MKFTYPPQSDTFPDQVEVKVGSPAFTILLLNYERSPAEKISVKTTETAGQSGGIAVSPPTSDCFIS